MQVLRLKIFDRRENIRGEEVYKMKLPEIAYSVNEENYYDQDPAELAEDWLDQNGYSHPVVIFSGVPYIPTSEDEVNFMEGEGFRWLVENVRPEYIYIDGELKEFENNAQR